MRKALQIISWLALAATVVPSFVFLVGRLELADMKLWMLVATAVWFVATPLWMERKATG